MVTLLPALLVICGRWVFWPKRPAFGSAEPTAVRPLGQGRPPDLGAPARGVGGHRRAAAGRLPRACSGSTPTAWPPTSSTPRSSARHGPEGARRRTAWPTPPTPIRSSANADSAEAVAEALAGVEGSARPPSRSPRAASPTSAPRSRATLRPRRPSTPSRTVRDAVQPGRRAPTPWSAAVSAIYLDTKIASTRDNLVIIPIVLLVVFLILMHAAAGAGLAADPDRHGRAVLRRGARHLGPALRVRLRLRRAIRSRASRCSPSCSWSPWASTTTSS